MNAKNTIHQHILHDDKGYIIDKSVEPQYKILDEMFKKNSGGCVFITGAEESGKHAILTKCLKNHNKRSFYMDVGSFGEDYCAFRSGFQEQSRSAISVTFKDQTKIVEGEVVSCSDEKIVLKTVDMESAFEVGVKLKKELKRERVVVGDIIRIYKELGYVQKVGRSSDQRMELRGTFVPKIAVPEGECIKTDTLNTQLSLRDIDVINSSEHQIGGLYSRTETIPLCVCDEIDQKLIGMNLEKKVDINREVVVIEDATNMNEEHFRIIMSYKKSGLFPYVVIMGEMPRKEVQAHILTLKMPKITQKVIEQIIAARVKMRSCNMNEAAISHAVLLGVEKGIKYAIQLLEMAKENGTVTLENLKKTESLFGIL